MGPNRRAAVTLVVAPVVLALGACASPGGPGAGPSSVTSEPADVTTLADRAARAGIAPDLVYVTQIEGFEVATQSVGVMGDDGMSAVYVERGGGATVMLTTARDVDPSVPPCAELSGSSAGPMRCVVERGEAQVVLEGDGVDTTSLRAAAESVRVPTADELSQLFADLPVIPETPVERGDLPAEGDGAPDNTPGLGG